MLLFILLVVISIDGPVKALENLPQRNVDPLNSLEKLNLDPKQDMESDLDLKPDLGKHDLDLKSDLVQYDLDSKPDLSQHDLDFKSDLSQHDLDTKPDLSQHESNLKRELGQQELAPKQDLNQHKLAPKHDLGQREFGPKQDLNQHNLDLKQDIGQNDFDLKQDLSQKHNIDPPSDIKEQYLHYNPNATSCEDFLNNTVFNPESVLDVDWKIFYFWSPEPEASYNIRFSRASDTLIDRFRQELDKEVKPPVDWTAAELFMESSIDFSALYIKTNQSGKYRLIPTAAFDYPALPMLLFALKVVKPGYLGIANCRHRFCYALAPVDKMPLHYELDEAASNLGFFSNYNRSYTYVRPEESNTYSFHQDNVDIDDDDLDLELDPSKIEMF